MSSDEPYFPVVKADAGRRVIYFELYPAMRRDTDREAMIPDEVDKSSLRFLSSGRHKKVDIEHSFQESGCEVVEHFKVRPGDPDFPSAVNNWIYGVQVTPEVWEKYEKGEINGLSWGTQRPITRTPYVVDVWHPIQAVGKTDERGAGLLPVHSHDLDLKFDDNSKPIPTYTGVTLGHRHGVKKTTSTELNLDHAHPYFIEPPDTASLEVDA